MTQDQCLRGGVAADKALGWAGEAETDRSLFGHFARTGSRVQVTLFDVCAVFKEAGNLSRRSRDEEAHPLRHPALKYRAKVTPPLRGDRWVSDSPHSRRQSRLEMSKL